MILLLLLTYLSTGSTFEVQKKVICESCVFVSDTCYNSSKILQIDAPFRNETVIHKIGILRSENKLFYSFEPMIEDPEYFKIGFVNLDNNTVAGVFSSPGLVANFGTFDVDQDNTLVYMGGSIGIYVFDNSNLKFSLYSSAGDEVRNIFYKNNVYFTKNYDTGIIVKKGDSFRELLKDVPIKKFVINKYEVVVFLNYFGLFVSKGSDKHRISSNPFFRGLTLDLDGVIYAWWVDGIYKISVDNKDIVETKIERVAKLPSIGAMTFDNDNNIMFTVERDLFRLTKVESGCYA